MFSTASGRVSYLLLYLSGFPRKQSPEQRLGSSTWGTQGNASENKRGKAGMTESQSEGVSLGWPSLGIKWDLESSAFLLQEATASLGQSKRETDFSCYLNFSRDLQSKKNRCQAPPLSPLFSEMLDYLHKTCNYYACVITSPNPRL